MIVFLQFPITDIRKFVSANLGELAKPNWPTPSPYADFIRSFGMVKPRGKGGASGWVGENDICDSRHALKLDLNLPPFRFSKGEIAIKCADRHFFYSGTAVGKYELVLLSMPYRVELTEDEFDQLINYILGIPAFIHFPDHRIAKGDLFSIRGSLSQLYLYSSSLTKKFPELKDKKLILAGQPLVFCELSANESIHWSSKTRQIDLFEKDGVLISQKWIQKNNKRVQAMVLQHKDSYDMTRRNGRLLRMYLMRLHAEYESIRDISNMIEKEVIKPHLNSPESDALQKYLNKTTRNISKAINRAKDIGDEEESAEVEKIAFEILERFNPGQREAFIDTLKRYEIRPQITRKVDEALGRIEEKVTEMAKKAYQAQMWEKIIVYVTGLLFIGLVGFLVIRNEPIADPNFVVFIRIILSVVVAAFGATVPGMLNVDLSKNGLAIRASGALALFVITFLLSPSVIR